MTPESILKKYGRELEPEWTGYKPVWHAWYEPHMVWFMTYQKYLNRIIQIEENKPENEKTIRFRFFKPVAGQLKKTKEYEECVKAEKKWQKAYEKWRNAYVQWRKANKVWRKVYKEWRKVYEEWRTADASSIEKLHAKECKGVVWENNQMKF